MQKYIEIKWLKDVNIIQCTALPPYISATNDLMNNCQFIVIFILLYNELFQKMFLLLKVCYYIILYSQTFNKRSIS